ncbi:lipopolysaccharide heptosyltransferase I [Caenimonas soli]|uniref:lipopolysaccharide heptosyltransferase I n=1 Tax=Caenimonas soli TaxID=2735555 RepID=UPI001553A0C1|nr:lipopolysaccharide heptosyltransferase I [Caenimonas soli]NPC57268.1 lipopolysaccharide heptosyltransferase I [Caenimonas soli]
MKILIVKLSSLGDVVHAMPAVQDIRAAMPQARIDWVVEKSFAPLVQRCEGVQAIIGCELRRWRKSPLGAQTRHEWRAFRDELRSQAYDAVIDLQGLTKSALVARVARMAENGKRFALANQTEGSGYEAATRWVADVAIRIEPRVHAVARSRELCARALGYEVPAPLRFGLKAGADTAMRCVAFVHGTSRDDKCWPEAHWVDLGRRLIGQGFSLGLPHGNEPERERSERLAAALGPQAQVWPRLDLGQLTDRLAACAGVIGVDSGLSHIAVALDLPHVQIYNFDTAWRTGPSLHSGPQRQQAVYAQPTPSADAVWQAWQQVQEAAS